MKFSEINFISLIKSFSRKEISEFEKFISSPFFNSRKVLSDIFNELTKHYPEFKEESFSKEKLFSAVFPGKEFNDVLLRKYISILMKLAEDYLVCKDVLGNEEKKMISLLDQYDNMNLTAFFERQLSKIENNGNLNSKITIETFYFNHYREELKAGYYIKINKIYEIKSCLIKSQIYILLHLLMANTVYANMMLIVKKSFRNSVGTEYFDEFNEAFDLIGYLEKIPGLSENEKLFVSLCKIDRINFNFPYDINNLKIMKTIIFKMTDILSDNLLYTFFSHLNIYYLINISANPPELMRDLFENYKLMIEKGLYDRKGFEFINYSEYRTILNFAVKLKELDWTEKFIQRFSERHEPEIRESLISYSLALLNYERKNYDVSLKYISEIHISEVIMKLDVDVLLLLLYFDLSYIDSALSLIDAMRHFIAGEKHFSDTVKENHLNFLKFYRVILMCKINSNKHDTGNIKYEIMSCQNLRRKDWLLQKISEV